MQVPKDLKGDNVIFIWPKLQSFSNAYNAKLYINKQFIVVLQSDALQKYSYLNFYDITTTSMLSMRTS